MPGGRTPVHSEGQLSLLLLRGIVQPEGGTLSHLQAPFQVTLSPFQEGSLWRVRALNPP